MAMLRTRRLAGGMLLEALTQPATGGLPRATVPLYQCPEGKRAILRDCRFGYDGTPADLTIWLYLLLSGGLWCLLLSETQASGGNGVMGFGGMDVVLEPGDELAVGYDPPGFGYALSGAELDILSVVA